MIARWESQSMKEEKAELLGPGSMLAAKRVAQAKREINQAQNLKGAMN